MWDVPTFNDTLSSFLTTSFSLVLEDKSLHSGKGKQVCFDRDGFTFSPYNSQEGDCFKQRNRKPSENVHAETEEEPWTFSGILPWDPEGGVDGHSQTPAERKGNEWMNTCSGRIRVQERHWDWLGMWGMTFALRKALPCKRARTHARTHIEQ